MICIGLDYPQETPIEIYIRTIENIDADWFKLNPAFNPRMVERVAVELNKRNKKWIFDGKVGDVSHTNEYYAQYIYEVLGASGTTLNPYVGFESLVPFFEYQDKVNFILCKTTNKGSGVIQDKNWRKILDFVKETKSGLVFPATLPEDLLEVSKDLGDDCLILSPGVGAQGGSAFYDLKNVIYSASRSIIFSEDPIGSFSSIKNNLYVDDLETSSLTEKIMLNGMIKWGDFTLSSGLKSDFYIDLRKISSHPDLFYEVSHELSKLVKSRNLILGVESASISLATSVGFILNRPFGYVRKTHKEHGSKRLVEGIEPRRKKITLIEDVITTGKSVLKAIESAEREGYIINQVIAVVERSSEVRDTLLEKGISFESLIKISPFPHVE